MFNVLPDNLKKLCTHEYYVRVLIVSCVLIILLQIFTLIFIFPSLLISNIKKQEVQQEVAALQEAPRSSHTTTVSDTITSTNSLLKTINTTLVYPTVTPYFNTVLSQKTADIQLGDLSYTVVDATHATIVVIGVSSTRDALVAFVKGLQNSKMFSKVDLPVSNLAKDANIEFTLNITIGQQP